MEKIGTTISFTINFYFFNHNIILSDKTIYLIFVRINSRNFPNLEWCPKLLSGRERLFIFHRVSSLRQPFQKAISSNSNKYSVEGKNRQSVP